MDIRRDYFNARLTHKTDRDTIPLRISGITLYFLRSLITGLGGRVVMQRTATPFTPVRFRLQPPMALTTQLIYMQGNRI